MRLISDYKFPDKNIIEKRLMKTTGEKEVILPKANDHNFEYDKIRCGLCTAHELVRTDDVLLLRETS